MTKEAQQLNAELDQLVAQCREHLIKALGEKAPSREIVEQLEQFVLVLIAQHLDDLAGDLGDDREARH